MELVYFRALELSDLERTHKWHNDKQTYRSIGGTFRYVSRTTEEEWLLRKQNSKDEVNLAVCLSETDQHIGNVYIRNIDWISRHAELHIMIGETVQRSKGFGFAAFSQLQTYAFNELGLRRVYVTIQEGNHASIKIAEKLGFTKEGVLRDHAFLEGKFIDFVVMGVSVDNQNRNDQLLEAK